MGNKHCMSGEEMELFNVNEERNRTLQKELKLEEPEESDMMVDEEKGLHEAINWYIELARHLVQCDPWISTLRVLEQLVSRGPLRSAEQVLWLFGGISNFRRAVRNMETKGLLGRISVNMVFGGKDPPFRFNLREVDEAVLLRSPHAKTYNENLMDVEDFSLEMAEQEPMESAEK